MERIKEADQTQSNENESQYGQGKEAILCTATKLFSSKGYKQTTLKDISCACGMNSALISYYFGGKRGLLKSVLQQKLENFEQLFLDLEHLGSKLQTRDFIAFIKKVLENCEEDPSILHISQWSLIDKEESSAKYTQDVCSIAEKKISQSLCYLNPKLGEAKSMARVLMIGSLIQKYTELFWSHPNYREFPVNAKQMQGLFKEQILNMLPQIIFSEV